MQIILLLPYFRTSNVSPSGLGERQALTLTLRALQWQPWPPPTFSAHPPFPRLLLPWRSSHLQCLCFVFPWLSPSSHSGPACVSLSQRERSHQTPLFNFSENHLLLSSVFLACLLMVGLLSLLPHIPLGYMLYESRDLLHPIHCCIPRA